MREFIMGNFEQTTICFCETLLSPKNTEMRITEENTLINSVAIITEQCWESIVKNVFEQACIRGCMPSDKTCLSDMIKGNGFKTLCSASSIKDALLSNIFCPESNKYLVKVYGNIYYALELEYDGNSCKCTIKGLNVGLSNLINRRVENIWEYNPGIDYRTHKTKNFKSREMPKDYKVFTAENKNPNGRQTGDCVVRALSTVYKCSWYEALNLMGEKTGFSDLCINSTENINSVLRKLDFKRHQMILRNNKQLTGKQFCEFINQRYKNGERVFAYVGRSHCAAVIPIKLSDGKSTYKISDTWDCTNRNIGEYWVCERFVFKSPKKETENKKANIGDEINHPVFGTGVISNISGKTERILLIEFDNHEKRSISEKWLLKNT